MIISSHAVVRAQQRGIPPLIVQWLNEFGEEDYDGHGGIRRYFSKRSIRKMERIFGCVPIRRLADYLDSYMVESSHDGKIITIGHLIERGRKG
jgi:hypothetical protein